MAEETGVEDEAVAGVGEEIGAEGGGTDLSIDPLRCMYITGFFHIGACRENPCAQTWTLQSCADLFG